jgi:transposase
VSEATAKAVAEYQSGKSIRQVAELVGGSYRWVREALVDAGVLRRQRKRTEKSAKQRAEESLQAVFIAAYRGGLSIEAAASNVGHSYSWGRGVLVDAHVPRRGSGTRRRTDADRPGWL